MLSIAHPRGGETHRVAKKLLRQMHLFQRQPDLLDAGKYTIKAEVDPDVVDLFFARVMGDDAAVVTAKNAEHLRALSDEFGFSGFDDEIGAVLGGAKVARSEADGKLSISAVKKLLEAAWLKDGELRFAAGLGHIVVGKTPAQVEKEFAFETTRPLDGIIAYLTSVCGGNVHEKGVVEVTGSSLLQEGFEAQNAVDLGAKSWFCTQNVVGQWICYDFKGRSVTPTSYSLETDGWNYPRAWAFEVSNDGKWWEVVDRRENNGQVTGNFTIRARMCGSFRFLRFRQIGKNHCDRDNLRVGSIEIFGTLFSE